MRVLLAACVALLLLTGKNCRAQGIAPVISAIRIVGNQRVEQQAIRLHIASQVGQPLSNAIVDRDIKSIYRMGFFERVSAQLENAAGKTVLVYRVKERPLVSAVRLEGLKAIKPTDEKIVEATKLHRGMILDPALVSATVRGLKKACQKHGYLDAQTSYHAVPGPGNTETAVFRVNEGPLVLISGVKFTGNKHFSSRQLRGVMETSPHNMLSWLFHTGKLNRDTLRKDVDRLTAFYYDHGYLDARVAEPQIVRRGKWIVVQIQVDEGKPFKVGKIDFAGTLKVPPGDLLKLLTTKSGQTFRGSRLQHDMLTLSDFYSDRGYAFVNVNPRTDVLQAQHRVNVSFDIQPGHEVTVDRIDISGNTKTTDKVIRRELTIQEQEPYSADEIRESEMRLDQLGYFSQTQFTTSPGPQPDKIDLNVHVIEADTASFQLGGGLDSYAGVFGNFSLGDRNLFGGGESIMFNAMVGYMFQNYSVTYTEPWFLDMPLSVSLELFDNEMFLFSFNQTTAGFSVNSYYPLTELGFKKIGPFSLSDVNLGLGYQFESVGITGLAPLTTYDILSQKGFTQVSEIMPSIRRFTVDNPTDPRSGSVESISMELAGLGGGGKFAKALLHARFFWSFIRSPRWGSWVYSPSVTFGIGTNLVGGTGGELPLYERFFPGGVGGEGDVRGYQLYSLGPQVTVYDQIGEPVAVEQVGGSKELLFQNQIGFPLLSSLGLRGFVFLDAGQAYFLHESMPLTSLQAAWGLGIFWRSPFGPITLDIGIPINPRPNDMGESFDFGAGTL